MVCIFHTRCSLLSQIYFYSGPNQDSKIMATCLFQLKHKKLNQYIRTDLGTCRYHTRTWETLMKSTKNMSYGSDLRFWNVAKFLIRPWRGGLEGHNALFHSWMAQVGTSETNFHPNILMRTVCCLLWKLIYLFLQKTFFKHLD